MIMEVFPPFERKKARHGAGAQRKPAQNASRNRRAHLQPYQHVPSALTSGQKAIWAQADERRFLGQHLALLCGRPASRPSTALPGTGGCGGSHGITARARSAREATTICNVPCSRWANRTQGSLVCWNKATE